MSKVYLGALTRANTHMYFVYTPICVTGQIERVGSAKGDKYLRERGHACASCPTCVFVLCYTLLLTHYVLLLCIQCVETDMRIISVSCFVCYMFINLLYIQ